MKNLNPCHQMLFLGSYCAKIAFSDPDLDPAGRAYCTDTVAGFNGTCFTV